MGLLTIVRNHFMELRSKGTLSYHDEYPHRANIQNGLQRPSYEVDMVIAPRNLIIDPNGLNKFMNSVFNPAFLGNPNIVGKEFTPFASTEIRAGENLLKIGDMLLLGDFGSIMMRRTFESKDEAEAEVLLNGMFSEDENDNAWVLDHTTVSTPVAMSISVRAYPDAEIALASTRFRKPGNSLRYGWSEIDPTKLEDYRNYGRLSVVL